MKKIFCLSLILLAIVLKLHAQQDTIRHNKYYYWVEAGLGGGFNADIFTGRYSLNGSFHQKYFLKFNRQISNENFNFSLNKPPNRLIHDENYSFLIGIGKYPFKYLAVMIYTGISYGKGTYRGNIAYYQTSGGGGFGLSGPTTYPVYEMQNYNYIGFPIELSILFTSRFIGYSLDAYANFHKYPEFGMSINSCLGKMRRSYKN